MSTVLEFVRPVVVDAVRTRTHNGYVWKYSEQGAHFFVKQVAPLKWSVVRVLSADFHNGNFEFCCETGLSNEVTK